MKRLSNVKRAILSFLACLAILSSLVLIISMVFKDSIYALFGDEKLCFYIQIGLLLFVLLYSVLSFLAFKRDKLDEEFIVQDIPDGQLRISLKVIEGIVKASIEKYENLRLVSQKLVSIKNKLEIKLQIDVSGTEPIPIIADRLKKELIAAISHSTGIDNPVVQIDAGISERASFAPIMASESETEEAKQKIALEKKDEALIKENKTDEVLDIDNK